MENDKIKEAFLKIKEDMIYLGKELIKIKEDQNNLKILIQITQTNLNEIKFSKETPTDIQKKPTYFINPTDNPTVPQEIKGLKYPNFDTSTGNKGVPTDRQTNQQIDRQKENSKDIESKIQTASEIIGSLDRIKKEIRFKFKQLTPQEMAVFSTIYQLEDQNIDRITYKEISLRLNLSESSIRDYIQKILNKGIPIKKQRLNNKTILLSISPDLKQIATLSTIINLREL